METITLHTESYLFVDQNGEFRAIPFYELSYDEWVVYENGKAKYFLNLSWLHKPLIHDINLKISKGEYLEDIILQIGYFLGKNWTTYRNIKGSQIPDSHKPENIDLLILEDLTPFITDITFVATDEIDFDVLLIDERFLDTYLHETWGFESTFVENFEMLIQLLSFLFQKEIALPLLATNNGKDIFDLTPYKHSCISKETLEEKYHEWLAVSKRKNTMGEYGRFIFVIEYISTTIQKKNLLLITEKRRYWIT